MSAIALCVQDNCVLMAGDGAASAPDTGALVGSMSKITVMPELSAVMGITGVGGFDHLIGWFMPPHVRTFDDLTEVLPELVKHCHSNGVESGMFAGGDFRTNICVAGWSDARQKYEGWRVVSYAKEAKNGKTGEKTVLEPWKLLPMPEDGIWCSTAPTVEIETRFKLNAPHPDDDNIDTLIRNICAARAKSGISEDGGAPFNAGCYVQIAMVQKDQASTWIAHRWPEDEIGKPIDPSRGLPMPQHLMDRDAET